MLTSLFKLLLVFLLLILVQPKSEAKFEEWCVAVEWTPESELQEALYWACGKGGADCSKIQIKGPCYEQNTMRDHASYAFNDYYQKSKNKGASCYFNGAASPQNSILVTAIVILIFFPDLECFSHMRVTRIRS